MLKCLQRRVLIILLLAFSTIISSNVAGLSLSCSESQCNGATIRYPFWKIDPTASTVHCGYPGLGVNCSSATVENTYPILALPNDTASYYYVTNVDYKNKLVTLVDTEVSGQDCPRPRRNVSVAPVPLKYTLTDVNLSFYANCSVGGDGSSVASTGKITCLGEYTDRSSYVFMEGNEAEGFDWIGKCEEKLLVPVKDPAAKPASIELVKEGFEMEWWADGTCKPCEESGGKCGFDHRTWEPVCFCGNAALNSTCPDGNNISLKIYIGIGCGFIGVLSLAIVLCYVKKHRHRCLFFNRQSTADRDIENFIEQNGSLAPKRFSYSEVKRMTNSFRDKLGSGGFGDVYQGKLPDGTLVAVKLLNSAKGNGEDFINEVASISKTSHVNIVALLGFCFEFEKRALIYEYMSNGSLDGYIRRYGSPDRTERRLAWENLYQIAVGIARGLDYLHRGCSTMILHLDIKPQNILLDDDFHPKISDFGLSRLCLGRESVISSLRAGGTIGYVAPEVFSISFIGVSHKSDVYSYGMVLMEMVGGRHYLDYIAESSSSVNILDRFYQLIEPGHHFEYDDEFPAEDKGTEIPRKMAMVGLWCIQIDPTQRPSMSRVIEMLQGSIDALPIPPKPALFFPATSPKDSSSASALL